MSMDRQFLVAVCLLQVVGCSNVSQRHEFFDVILNEDYDPRVPPLLRDDPVLNTIQLYILGIDSISASTMDFKMSFFIRQRWYDNRLAYRGLLDIPKVELDTRVMSNVWVPDLYIKNEKKANTHTVTVPNKLMHIYPDGLVVYSMRVTGTFSCQMYLHKYPLDQQTCSIQMESYGYSTDTLKFQWNDIPLVQRPNLTLPQFEIGHISNHTCDITYANVTFTCLGIDIEMSRAYGYYITQVYIPSFLIVCLSWVSFWLNIDAIPARISLGLLTILTMTTQSSGARATLPRVSYIKAIDVWMATCLVFVFAALIEFSYVNVKARVQQRRKSSVKELPLLLHRKEDDSKEKTQLDSKCRDEARRVDKLSRIIFPLVFLCFNIVYWSVYSVWVPEMQKKD
ncbi:glycine receptor subunit alpha-2-like isoform X2 [Saccostrea echinata]|uniref:glycine receptor subunit alpha-2-like isoform X2 n=1 Tax=Saccostrea echinata TaxID=191078 RepID=UPI002A8102F3|nr:glycine receptor subunit alpha-2-like isoform X2 [Saccostrea echinata]